MSSPLEKTRNWYKHRVFVIPTKAGISFATSCYADNEIPAFVGMTVIYKLILTIILCLLAASCGFQPMYGKHSALAENSPLEGNLIIAPIGGHEGQIFKIALEDRLNPKGLKSAQPEYRLDVTLVRSLVPAVVKSDGTIERYIVQFTTTFRLTQIADNKLLLTSTIGRTGSYNVAINANFATYEAEQDTIERTLQEIAEDYVLRLADYFASPEKKPEDKP